MAGSEPELSKDETFSIAAMIGEVLLQADKMLDQAMAQRKGA